MKNIDDMLNNIAASLLGPSQSQNVGFVMPKEYMDCIWMMEMEQVRYGKETIEEVCDVFTQIEDSFVKRKIAEQWKKRDEILFRKFDKIEEDN